MDEAQKHFVAQNPEGEYIALADGVTFADMSADIDWKPDGEAFRIPPTRLLLPSCFQRRLCGYAVESAHGIDGCISVHGIAS